MPQCYLAVEQLQVMHTERVGPVLFCVAASHSLDKSWCGFLTKWWTAHSFPIKKMAR